MLDLTLGAHQAQPSMLASRLAFLALLAVTCSTTQAQTPLISNLAQPRAIEILADGRILVGENGLDSVRAFTADGEEIGFFGPVVSNPLGIAALADGSVLVADFNRGIELWSAVGDRVRFTPLNEPQSPIDVAQAADGTIYVALFYEARIYTYDLATGDLTLFLDLSASAAEVWGVLPLGDDLLVSVQGGDYGPGSVIRATGSAVEAFTAYTGFGAGGKLLQVDDGRILVMDRNEGEIEAFAPDGTWLETVVADGGGVAGLVQRSNGELLYADRTSRVYALGIVVAGEAQGPDALALALAPNPVASVGTVRLDLDRAGRVRVDLFDVLGRRVRTVLDAPLAAGAHTVEWSAAGLAPGRYLARLVADGRVVTRAVSVVR